jgi:hypothetical protein
MRRNTGNAPQFIENQDPAPALQKPSGNPRKYPMPLGLPAQKTTEPLPSFQRAVWLDTRAAAEWMGSTVSGIRNRVYRGQLKPHKPFGRSGRSYFKRTDLDRLMESS